MYLRVQICTYLYNNTHLFLMTKKDFTFVIHLNFTITFQTCKHINMKMVIIGAVAVALGVIIASFVQKKLNSTTTA